MIIPLSLENAILRRLPWISIGIAVTCVAVLVKLTGADKRWLTAG